MKRFEDKVAKRYEIYDKIHMYCKGQGWSNSGIKRLIKDIRLGRI